MELECGFGFDCPLTLLYRASVLRNHGSGSEVVGVHSNSMQLHIVPSQDDESGNGCEAPITAATATACVLEFWLCAPMNCIASCRADVQQYQLIARDSLGMFLNLSQADRPRMCFGLANASKIRLKVYDDDSVSVTCTATGALMSVMDTGSNHAISRFHLLDIHTACFQRPLLGQQPMCPPSEFQHTPPPALEALLNEVQHRDEDLQRSLQAHVPSPRVS